MITEQQVHHACNVIDARGEEPKYDLIRAELGDHGSWSTIRKYRATWLAQDHEVPPVPEALHAQVASIAAAVWKQAYPAASNTFGEERRGAAAEITQLADALTLADAEIEEKATAIIVLTKAADDLRMRLAQSEAVRRDEAARHEALLTEVATLSGMIVELKAFLGTRADAMPMLRLVGSDPACDERTA